MSSTMHTISLFDRSKPVHSGDVRHYRIGKKFVSQTGDQVVLYRAMLKDIFARGKKKVANQTKVIAAQKEAFKEYVNRYYGPDSTPDDGNEGW